MKHIYWVEVREENSVCNDSVMDLLKDSKCEQMVRATITASHYLLRNVMLSPNTGP